MNTNRWPDPVEITRTQPNKWKTSEFNLYDLLSDIAPHKHLHQSGILSNHNSRIADIMISPSMAPNHALASCVKVFLRLLIIGNDLVQATRINIMIINSAALLIRMLIIYYLWLVTLQMTNKLRKLLRCKCGQAKDYWFHFTDSLATAQLIFGSASIIQTSVDILPDCLFCQHLNWIPEKT